MTKTHLTGNWIIDRHFTLSHKEILQVKPRTRVKYGRLVFVVNLHVLSN